MKKDLEKIEKYISNIKKLDASIIRDLLSSFLKNHVKRNRVENYIGDYPTFIEPVYLEDNVKIGNDVLLGPNVYIGKNSEIGDYVEISNAIVFDNVKIGENLKLNHCIVAKNSSLNFKNINLKNCVMMGQATSEENLKRIEF